MENRRVLFQAGAKVDGFDGDGAVFEDVDTVPDAAGVVALPDGQPSPARTAVMVVEHTFDQAFFHVPPIEARFFVRTIHAYGKDIVAFLQQTGNIEGKRVKIPFVPSQAFTIEEDIGEVVYAVEMEGEELPIVNG